MQPVSSTTEQPEDEPAKPAKERPTEDEPSRGLVCGICWGRYEGPRHRPVLCSASKSCGNTFCEKCFLKVLNSGRRRCPCCREPLQPCVIRNIALECLVPPPGTRALIARQSSDLPPILEESQLPTENATAPEEEREERWMEHVEQIPNRALAISPTSRVYVTLYIGLMLLDGFMTLHLCHGLAMFSLSVEAVQSFWIFKGDKYDPLEWHFSGCGQWIETFFDYSAGQESPRGFLVAWGLTLLLMYATFRVGLLIGLAIRMAARIRRGVLELSVKREKSIFAAMSTLKYSVFAAFLPRLMLSTPSSLMGFLSFSVDLALRRPPGFSRTTDVVSGKAGWEVDLDVIRESLRGPEVKLVQETECITHTSWLATPLSYQLSHLPCALLALCGLLSGWALMELKGLWRRPNWRPTRFLQRVSEIVQRFCFLVQGIGGVLGVLALSQSPLVLLWSFLHDFITAWRSTGVLRHCYGMFACIWTRRGSLSGEALAIIALARVAHDDNADEGVRAWARRVLPALRARGTEDGEQPPFLPQEEVGEGQPAVEGMGGAEVEGEDDTGPQGAGAVGAPERQRPFRRRRRRRILSLTRALVAPFAAVGRSLLGAQFLLTRPITSFYSCALRLVERFGVFARRLFIAGSRVTAKSVYVFLTHLCRCPRRRKPRSSRSFDQALNSQRVRQFELQDQQQGGRVGVFHSGEENGATSGIHRMEGAETIRHRTGMSE